MIPQLCSPTGLNGHASPRPVALTVNDANIPAELKAMPAWVVWKYHKRGGRWTKPPIGPLTTGFAAIDDPRTWASFQDALCAYRQNSGTLDGIGIVLTENHPLVGVDLDHVIDPETRQLKAAAR